MDYPKSVPGVGLASGKFVDENPATGMPGSLIPAQWGNSITQEILNAMAAGGEQPDETRTDQLASAITQIGLQVRQAYKGAGFGYTASETLLPGAAGHWHRINLGGITLSLPPKANVVVGKSITFHNASPAAATIKANGAEVISLYGAGSNTLKLNAAEWVELVFNPDAIYITKRGKITEVAGIDSPGLVPTTVVGSARNLTMSVVSASASATITADELVVETGLGGMGYRLGGFNKAINLAAVGIGGMDTGAAPANGFVAIYAIYNPLTGVSALLGTDVASTTASEVYTGGNMPGGFTASALVSVWRTKNSLFQIGFMDGREVSFVNEKVAATTVPIAVKSLSLASVIPPSTKSVTGWLAIAGVNTVNASITVSSSVSSIGVQQVAGNSMAETIQNISTGSFSNLKVIIPQTIFWSTGLQSGTYKEGSINISGYRF